MNDAHARRIPLTLRGIALGTTLLGAVATVTAQPLYEVVDLGTLGGGLSYARGISENGAIAGQAQNSSGALRAVVWLPDGTITELGNPASPSGYYGVPVAVNDSGGVAGYGEANPQSYRGYSVQGGAWTQIGTLPGHNESITRDINEAGQIVGSSFILGGEHRAVMWDQGVLTDLGTLGGSSNAYGMNDAGQIVGYTVADLPGGSQGLRGFVWENGAMTALEPLAGEVATEANDINEAGDVVGSSWYYTTQFFSAKGAALWPGGTTEAIDLGFVPAPPGSCSQNPYWHKSIARAINNCGQIVGGAMCITSGASQDGFFWQDGVMYNLNDLVPAGSGWDFLDALDINDAGQIVGIGLFSPDPSVFHAFLLNPLTPSPCATSACSEADVTTQGAGAGDPGFGTPDGAVSAADLNYFVNAWVAQDAAVADLTTQGAAAGDPGHGVPDGVVSAADIQFYVNLWIEGCP